MTRTRLVHGSGPHQWAEFALPRDTATGRVGGPPPGLVVNLHGGFWHAAYDLTHARPLCAGLRRRGWATLNLEYRRVGNEGGGWPGTFDDVGNGLDLVHRLVAEHHVDPARVVVMGHSAGGHLALWVAGTTNVAIAGVVAIAAVTDLVASHEASLSDRGTATSDLMGGPPDHHPDRWRRASPIATVPLAVPAVLVHGSEDRQVPLSQSREYVVATTAVGGDAHLEVVTGDDHFAVLEPMSATFDTAATAAESLVAVRS